MPQTVPFSDDDQTCPDSCPKCGTKMHVVTTQRQPGKLVRYRECTRPGCHTRVKSIEKAVVYEPKNRARAIKRGLRAMVAAIAIAVAVACQHSNV
jgi:hypothetical protein